MSVRLRLPRWPKIVAFAATAASTVLIRAAAAAPDSGVSPTPSAAREPPSKSNTPVQSEHVYAFGERPRPDGPVRASVADEELARWNVGGVSDPHHPSNRAGYHVA